MRLSLLAAALLLSSCGGAPEPAAVATAGPAPAAPAAKSAAAVPALAEAGGIDASRAMLAAYIDAMNRHDGAAATSYFAEDVTIFDSLVGKVLQGRAEAGDKVVGMYLRAVPDGHWELRNEPIVSASGFSYEWKLTGVNLGNWTSYLRGRGQKIDFKGISIVRLKDGKIVYQANYFDATALGQQAGW